MSAKTWAQQIEDHLDGPKLEWLESLHLRFLWLVPITERERDFKKLRGAAALEALFEERRFKYLDPKRRSQV